MTDIIPSSEGGAIQKHQPKELVSTTSFFRPDAIEDALEAAGWDVSSMMNELVSIATDKGYHETGRGGSSPNCSAGERMAAMRLIKEVVQDAITEKLVGRISKELGDGKTASLDMESLRLLEGATGKIQNSMDLLQVGEDSDEVIDLEDKDGCGVYSATVGEADGDEVGTGCGRLDRPGGSGWNGNGYEPAVDDDERCGGTEEAGPYDDPTRTGGAEDERGPGLPEQSGRSNPSEEPGDPVVPDSHDAGEAEWGDRTDRQPDSDTAPEPTKQTRPFVPGIDPTSISRDRLRRLLSPDQAGSGNS